MPMLAAALEVLFPPSCPGCGRGHPPRFCDACLASIPLPADPLCAACGLPIAPGAPFDRCRSCRDRPPAFARARSCAVFPSAGSAANPLRAVLHRFKYEQDLAEAGPLADLLARRCPPGIAACDVAVPVPLHLSRLRWRGFNQAQLLLAPLARAAGIPTVPGALERLRPTDPQVRLDVEARRRNVRGAFRVREPDAIRGRRVLLFDDVITSGATADACARALAAAGARGIEVLALAHAVVA
jgi:ComF family protein